MTEKPVALPSLQRCGEIAFPGPNEQVCVADAGHEEGKHNFWPRELVSSQDIPRRKTINFTPDDMEPRLHAKPGTYLRSRALPSSPAPTQAGWISVEEKLPPTNQANCWKDNGQYLCSDVVLAFNGTQTTAEMLTNPKGEKVWTCGDQTVKNVTHWMPLPSPPVSSEKAEEASKSGAAESVPSTPSPTQISIEVYQHDWMPGFAAFNDDGWIAEAGRAHVTLNLGSLLAAVKTGDLESKDLPYLIAESLMHEAIHALEAWANVEFSEDRVEELLTKYREKYERATIWEYTGAAPKSGELGVPSTPVETASRLPCPSCGADADVFQQMKCAHPWHDEPLPPTPPTAAEVRISELESQLTQVREELHMQERQHEGDRYVISDLRAELGKAQEEIKRARAENEELRKKV